MKRFVITACAALLLAYGLPLCTLGMDKAPEKQKSQSPEGSELASAQGYDEKTQVTVLIDGQVQTLPLSQYLRGVVAAEMPASFPAEALRAQAVAARTYTLYKLDAYEQGVEIPVEHQGAQLCNDFTHCKAYVDVEAMKEDLWGDQADKYQAVIDDAVSSTDGMVVTYQGDPIAAVFHAASSGQTEAALDVWGSSHPYLVSVESPGEEACPKYEGTVTISPQEFASKFWEKHPEANFNDAPTGWFKDSNRSQSGGIINVSVGGVRVSGTEIRTMLGLNSTNFTLEASDDALVFHTTGYGHGVGLSQYGARELALEGKNFSDILKWYYQGTEITIKT